MASNTNQDEGKMYKDLSTFLLSDRADLRLAATEAILQVTDQDGMKKLLHFGLIRPLAQNCSYTDQIQVSINALKSLVQLSSVGETSSQCLEDILEAGGINRMIEIGLSAQPTPTEISKSHAQPNETPEQIKKKDVDRVSLWKTRINFAMALLANLTRNERGAVQFVGKSLPDEAVPIHIETISEEEEEKGEGKQEQDTKQNEENEKDGHFLPPKPSMELLLARYLNDGLIDHKGFKSIVNNNSSQDGDDDDGGDGEVSHEYHQQMHMQDEDEAQKYEAKLNSQYYDPYQHMAAVLMNIAQVEAGRRFIVKIRQSDDPTTSSDAHGTSHLQSFLLQLKSDNPLRRRGIAGVVKNCCLDVNSAWWLMNIVKITKHILFPLSGPEALEIDEKKGMDPDLWLLGPDKRRESDHYTRLFLVHSILLLCASGRKSREQLRLERVYVILKYMDMVEPHEDVSESINECVQFLRRDEEGTQEGSSDLMVQQSLDKIAASTVAASQQVQLIGQKDYDDVD